jgi:hypothetical protein
MRDYSVDCVAITQVLQLYFDALDEKTYERLDEVFTAEAELRYSLDASSGPALSFAAMTARIRRFNTAFCFTQHLAGTPRIELDGDAARARTNLRALHVQQRPDGRRSTWLVHGVYWDRLVRTAAGWRIAERLFRVVHTEGDLLAAGEVGTYEQPPWS